MSDYKLVLYPNPVLEKVSKPVKEFNEELHKLLYSMSEIMLKSNGIGLAAPQVGVNKRVFIMQEQRSKDIIEFINPVLQEASETLENGSEGCLSAPGVYVSIPRPTEVLVQAFNRNGEPFTGYLTGIEARCAQHEMEHLDGKFFLDKTNRQQRRAALKQLKVKK